MEARLVRALVALVACTLWCSSDSAQAAGYRTRNFTVAAPTPQLAKEIGDVAEQWRKKLSIEWIGEEMPSWSKPCPIQAQVAPNLGAGGATSFVFDQGQVFGWDMKIQGSRERILDSVLPHEITHTIFACYFRQPLPRWADEGACTTVEHPSEIAKQERMLIQFLHERRGIPFSQMFAMKEYPPDVMPLYSQGHSVAQMLIESQGRQTFLDFLSEGLKDENWPRAVRSHYGYDGLPALQLAWLDWVKAGRPPLGAPTDPGVQLAGASSPANSDLVVRAQSPDRDIRPIPAAVADSGAGSVYAKIAARAKPNVSRPAPPPSGPIQDASMHPHVLRR
jgi:hypothetical protein